MRRMWLRRRAILVLSHCELLAHDTVNLSACIEIRADIVQRKNILGRGHSQQRPLMLYFCGLEPR